VKREQFWRELGVGPVWRLRGRAVEEAAPTAAPQAPPPPSPPAVAAPPAVIVAEPAATLLAETPDERAAAIAAMGWDELRTAAAACQACELCRRRKQAVLGVGDPDADWLFVGEGPGADEDERGEPFVGQAGKLLDAMLAAIDLRRGQNVYIANTVKCRPPGNRTPEPTETAACWPFLSRQIALLQPKLIVALGRPAAQTLLQAEVKIGAARGQLFEHQGIPLIVTYHPAYLLRNLPDKAKAWEDLCFMRQTMRGR